MSEGRNSRTGVRRLRVAAADAGQRLDNFLLRELKGIPRSRVYRLLRRGEVRVNGSRCRPDYRLAEQDEVRLPPVRLDPAGQGAGRVPDALREQLRQAIVHEDERILVLDKPSGIAVHGGSGLAFGVIEALRADRPDEDLELAHRLDRDTSGCLVVARRGAALREIHALLRDGEVEKHYAALLAGRWELGRKKIDAPVRTNLRQGGERVVRVQEGGKDAISVFDPRRHFGRRATLVDVEIHTGRTHQIRVHAAWAGHPVAGDDKYGDREFNAAMKSLGLRRLFLHSAGMAFRWPGESRRFEISVPLPADLQAVLDALAERRTQS